jgi:hypothetical protein
LSLKTTTILAALLATISVIATTSAVPALIPQAFAQDAADGTDDNNDDNGGNTVTATQSNSFTADISQSQSQYAGFSDDEDDDGTTVVQSADQGFCLQVNQQNAAAGNDATNSAANAIVANDESFVDCS